MKRFHYIEAYYPVDEPGLLYFRHTPVTARNESRAYDAGMSKRLGRPGDRFLNNYVIRVDPLEFAAYTRAAREEWPTLSGPSALSLEEVGLLVRDVASRRLRLAWDECTVGQVNVHAEETCIGAGRRIAEFIACVDRIDVEAVVHDVEHEFSKGCNPSLWAAFSSKIVPESYEGRYPRPLCPIDRYRRPSIDDRKPPPSATPVQAQGQADARSRTEEESAHVFRWWRQEPGPRCRARDTRDPLGRAEADTGLRLTRRHGGHTCFGG